MNDWWYRRRYWWWGLLGLGCLLLTGCPGHIRLSRQQLRGADPGRDLVAAPMLDRLRKAPATAVSVYGVRLLDTLKRAQALWGKPSHTSPSRYIWSDKQGNYHLRAMLGRQAYTAPGSQESSQRVVICQIDIFSPYQEYLHPRNRALLNPKRIESDSWRQKVFGSPGNTRASELDTRFTYPKRGFRLLLLSKLLPLQRKVNTVFTLYLNRAAMGRYQVTRIP